MDPYLMEGFGATKICDGLYIGDELASKDIDTIVINHITHIINCSAGNIVNHFESYGLRYLSFEWSNTDKDIILDPHEHTLTNIASFIEDARNMGESCLIHTKEGYSTSFTVFAGYFMLRFQWTLYKVLQFLDSRVPKVQIKVNCFKQLKLFEERLAHRHILTNDWNTKPINQDQLIIRNTYLNSLKNRILQPYNQFHSINKGKRKTLTWSQQQNCLTESITKPEHSDKPIIRPKPILKNSNVDPSVRRDCSTGKRDEPKEQLNQSRHGSNYKLSVKKKLPSSNPSATPPVPQQRPEERKIIYITANPIARDGSKKKMCEKEALPHNSKFNQRSKNEGKTSIMGSFSIGRQVQQENKTLLNQQNNRTLKSEVSDRQNVGTEKSYDHFKLTTPFLHDQQQPPRHKRELLNKSTENMNGNVGQDDNKLCFFTEMDDFNRKEELTKRLMKKITADKTVGLSRDEKQNFKFQIKSKHFEGDQLFKSGSPNGFLALNLKILNKYNSQNEPRSQSNDERFNLQTKNNNFVNTSKELEKPMSISKSIRNESPSTTPYQSMANSNNINKLNSSTKSRLNNRAASPLVRQNNSLMLKDSSSIIRCTFSKDPYKPKWKF